MQVFKFLILILIFGASSLIGILISKKYSNRVNELKEIKSALNMLETKIKFTYQPLPQIFMEIYKSVSSKINNIFKEANLLMNNLSVKEAWNKAIDNSILDINEEDKNIIKNLGNMLRTNRCRWANFTN